MQSSAFSEEDIREIGLRQGKVIKLQLIFTKEQADIGLAVNFKTLRVKYMYKPVKVWRH